MSICNEVIKYWNDPELGMKDQFPDSKEHIDKVFNTYLRKEAESPKQDLLEKLEEMYEDGSTLLDTLEQFEYYVSTLPLTLDDIRRIHNIPLRPAEHLVKSYEDVSMNIDEEELKRSKQNAQELVKNKKVYVPCWPEYLEEALESGYLKSTHEISESPEEVAGLTAVEKSLFRYSKDSRLQQRLTYGSITDHFDSKTGKGLLNSGTIAICLKDYVKKRTTVTKGASAKLTNCYDRLIGMPTPYTNPDGSILPLAGREIFPDLFKGEDEDIQAHIHAGLRRHDIEKVVFINPQERPSETLATLLREHQIRWESVEEDVELSTEEPISRDIAAKKLGTFWKTYNQEIVRQECQQRGRNLPETVQNKSAERMNKGMSKVLIDHILITLYDHAPVKPLKPEDAKNLNRVLNISDGHDYFNVDFWPRTFNKPKSFDLAPYRTYINPKTGTMIINGVYREDDQKWRNTNPPTKRDIDNIQHNLGIKYPPQEVSESLNASDILGETYRLAVEEYRKISGSNATYSSLKRVIIYETANPKTATAGSFYAADGTSKPSRKKDEPYETMIGTPLGQIIPFTLAQNPEKVGDGKLREVTDITLSQVEDILTMTLDIDEKKNS